MAANKKTVFIPFGTFDKSKCSLTDPFIVKSKNGQHETCNSSVRYKLEDGTYSDDIRLELFPRKTYGIFPSYPFGMDKKLQGPETINGYQFTYTLTSPETVNSPTKEEKYTIEIFDYISELMWEKLCEEVDKEDDSVIPPVSKNCYLGANKKSGVNKSYAIKPIYEYPNKQDDGPSANKKKEKDTSQPLRIYMKLNCFGSGSSLKCFTKIYGPGNKLVSPAKYHKVQCTIHPVLQLKKIFWGSHGKNTHGCSLNMHVSEMNIVPIAREGQRFLAPNPAPEEEEEDETQSFFHNPMGNEAPSKPDPSSFEEIDFSADSKNPIEDLEHSEEEEEKPKKKVSTKSTTSKSSSSKSSSSKKKHTKSSDE
jgi:hypothetical protein